MSRGDVPGGAPSGGTTPRGRASPDRVAPDLSPAEFRALLERATEIATGHWEHLPRSRAFTRPPDELVRRIRDEALPARGRPIEEVLDRIRDEVLPYPYGVGHPRWWGFINASAHPVGIASELIAATLNNNCAGTTQIAIDVEHAVVSWLAELVGLPAGTEGILVSGGSMANLTALAVARETAAPGTRELGLTGAERLAVYASTEVHSCVAKAVETLGLGRAALRAVPVDDEQRMDVGALKERIAADRVEGWRPAVLVGSAGTVGTGRIDPLDALADVAQEEGLWFHVDGAYGAFAAALPELRDRMRGIERADSLAVDPHKWLYVPYEAGATLIARPGHLARTFSAKADYLELDPGGYVGDPTVLGHRGIQLSRGFRALKVWATLQAVGLDAYRELWRHDIAVAREVIRLAGEHPRLEVLAGTDLGVFCLRYRPERGDVEAFNRELLDALYRDGRVFLGPGRVNGEFVLRGCVVNFRSTPEDARICVQAVAELGEALEAGQRRSATG